MFPSRKGCPGTAGSGQSPSWGHSTCRGCRMLVPLLSTYYVQVLGGTFTHMVLFLDPISPLSR